MTLAELVQAARSGDPAAARKLQAALASAQSEAWRADPVSMACHLDPSYQRARHLEALSEQLTAAAYEPDRRIVVSMPVRHGKSWQSSMWYPVWFLDRFPHKKIVLVGHGAAFAAKWGRRVRNLIKRHQQRLRVRLVPDLQAADCWETPEGGGMITAGIGGGINGEGADLLLVDDYCKNSKEAQSLAWRESVWDWWQSTAETRLEPGSSAVIVATRWHEDDLIGRLLAQGQGDDEDDDDNRDEWEQVVFPAVAEEGDALGRQPGEALWPERWPLWRLERKRRAKGPWVWSALYQQRPAPAEGGLFKREWFRYYTSTAPGRYRYRAPDGAMREIALGSLVRFCTVDLAASIREEADWTVCSTWGLAPDGVLFLLGVARVQLVGPRLVPMIRAELERWDASVAWIESQGFQLHVVQQARAAGLPVRELRADRDKVSRALPATAELEAGCVLWPAESEWLAKWEAEVLSFPRGHDDQVDTLSYAVQVSRGLASTPGVPQGLPEPDEWDEDDDEDGWGGERLRLIG